jgi:hypothetical protein
MSLTHSPTVLPSRQDFWSRALSWSGVTWFLIAAAGQLLFVYYIWTAYIPSTIAGEFARWNDIGLIMGFRDGDGLGNLMFISHVLLASIMTLAGLMQLSAPLRRAVPALHRASGRVFLVLAVYLAIGGVWMIWVRGARLNDILGYSSALECLIILVCAGFALHFARKRQIDRHHPWALRLFLAASGVWFIRVFYNAWFLAVGPVGVSRTMDGWYDYFASFGSVIIPLLVLQLYLQAGRSQSIALKASAVAVMIIANALTALGVVGATLIMWSPHF